MRFASRAIHHLQFSRTGKSPRLWLICQSRWFLWASNESWWHRLFSSFPAAPINKWYNGRYLERRSLTSGFLREMPKNLSRFWSYLSNSWWTPIGYFFTIFSCCTEKSSYPVWILSRMSITCFNVAFRPASDVSCRNLSIAWSRLASRSWSSALSTSEN